ncbi:D-ribose pyranase [Promicromonospora sukumoe]
MKHRGIINAALSGELARLGHTDLVAVADAGLPVPRDVPTVDLALVFGVPRFTQVLDALLDEIVIEEAWTSQGADGTPAGAWIDERVEPRTGRPAERIPHPDLKAMTARARLVVRTGEATAWANVVLRCGVPFAV